MSYEGFEENLCPRGHYWQVNDSVFSYGTTAEKRASQKCPECKQPPAFRHDVDCTNGVVYRKYATSGKPIVQSAHPDTVSAKKRLSHYEDIPSKDLLGNSYSKHVPCYTPIAHWKPT